MDTNLDQPEIVEDVVLVSAQGIPLDPQALKVIYTYLSGLAPQALRQLQTLNAQFGALLPAQVQQFEKELEFALSTFISLDPLIQQLVALLPTS